MKKLISCFTLFLFVMTSVLFGCSLEEKTIIYKPNVVLSVVYSNNVDYEIVENFSNKLNNIRGELSKIKTSDSPKSKYEIVIGQTDRDVSKQAYKHLSEVKTNTNQEYGFVIYCEENCLAVAYAEDELKTNNTINKALSVLINKCDNEVLRLKTGVVEKGIVNIVEEQRKLDNLKREQEWDGLYNNLKDRVGSKKAENIVSSLKSFYSIYDSNMISWIANLFDINAGGFYYSNSGRDNFGFGPDIESTYQILKFLQSTGVFVNYNNKAKEGLPEELCKKIALWVKGLQDENGYFYHPQWTKEEVDSHLSRRARDLTCAVEILKMFGLNPTYNTPLGDVGDYDGDILVKNNLKIGNNNIKAINIEKTSSVADHLQSVEKFQKYLEGLNIHETNYASYRIGNELAAQANQVVARDKVLDPTGKTTPLTDTLINWLNSKQDSTTGFWIKAGKEVEFNALNGAFKIICVYTTLKRCVPQSSKILNNSIELLMDSQQKDFVNVCYLYNIWYTIEMLKENITQFGNQSGINMNNWFNNILNNAKTYIDRSLEVIKYFIKEDGSSSYNQNHTSETSQGLPVAVAGTNEGDVNATTINLNGVMSHMFNVLGFDPIYQFGEAERIQFLLEISNLKPVEKH